MKYSNIITKLLYSLTTPSFLIKLNIWSFLNVKYFVFKSNSIIFFFLTNLKNLKIKFLKFNNYLNIYYYIVFFLLTIIILFMLII